MQNIEIIDGWVNISELTPEEVASNPKLSQLASAFGRQDDLLTARTLDDLLESMDEAGVGRAILSGTPLGAASGNPFGRLSVDYGEALRCCEMAEGRLRLGLYVDTAEHVTRISRIIRELAASNMIAIVRIVPSALTCDMTDGRLYHLYGTCEELGLPVSINVGIYGPRLRSRYQDPLLLEDVLVDFPDLAVVAAHMGHPWERLIIRLIRKFDNLSLMTSAFSPKHFDPDLIQFMASRTGSRRVMFASDWPLIPIPHAVREARKLDLDDDALAGFLGQNLARVVAWDDSTVATA